MKKIITMLLWLFLLFTLASCNGNDNTPNNNDSNIEVPDENENNNDSNTNKPSEDDNNNNNNDSDNKDDPIDDTNKEDEVVVDKNDLFVTIPKDRPIRVVQFADIHFGIEGKNWNNDKVDRTKKYMATIISEEKPDLIVCSGDNILSTGIKGLQSFIELIESYETPWIWVYGNHDAENEAPNFRKSDLSKYLENADTKYLLYNEGFIEAGYEDRYGNYSVKIYNESKDQLLGAFIILDSGERDYNKGYYRAITEAQIEWYNSEIDSLQTIYEKQENNKYEIIPTIVFSHIQLPEFQTAYKKAIAKDGAEFVIEQKLSDVQIDGINPEIGVNNGFYDTLVSKGSTKAYFVGHAHNLYFQVKMDGIILGFGPQTGFSKLFANNEEARKTHIYNINQDLTFTTDCINEIVRNKGLVFNATNGHGNANYIEDTGNYVFTTELGKWDRVVIDYYGKEITENFTRLTINNTNVSGVVKKTAGADYTTNLYFEDPDAGMLYCSYDKTNIYKFTYNPEENSLVVEIVEKELLQEGELNVLGVNKNTALTVWSKSGFTLKNTNSWCSSSAMMFIVCDSEGRIVYAVYNPSKYGDPTSNSYYTNPYYENDRNYTTNPAIVILEDNYKIVVPEGGFAISASGDSLITLVQTILDPNVEVNNDLLYLVLDRNSFNENLRIRYNSDTKVISTYYVA